jgi:hypothetical protein
LVFEFVEKTLLELLETKNNGLEVRTEYDVINFSLRQLRNTSISSLKQFTTAMLKMSFTETSNLRIFLSETRGS